MKNKKEQFVKGRREFIKNSALSLTAFTIVPRHVLGGQGFIAPSDKMNIACIGIGGKGREDVEMVSSENIIALCDVDQARAAQNNRWRNAYEAFPKASRYEDFREMFEKERDIDGVTISTPDHTHAVITMEAMKKGIHVYTQKPLTRTIGESRKVVDFAKKSGVVTQMGNQNHSNEGPRILNEMVWQGTIGAVKEVHCWTNRPTWPQGKVNLSNQQHSIPSTLNWDLWLGPAKYRDYQPEYVPFKWRGSWDFGCGALGDMGCHIIDYAFWALKLTAPQTIEAYSSPVYKKTAPLASLVTYTFKSGLDDSLVDLVWYDGGLKPNIPDGLVSERNLWNGSGLIMKGDLGTLVYGHKSPKPILLINGKEQDYDNPKEMIPRSVGHYQEWINECKGGKTHCTSNFDYAGLLNETVLLGNVAIRSGKKLEWDAENMKVTNYPEANQYLFDDYRDGWTL